MKSVFLCTTFAADLALSLVSAFGGAFSSTDAAAVLLLLDINADNVGLKSIKKYI